jgi:hypothetical protein
MNGCGFEALYHLMGAFHVITFCSCTHKTGMLWEIVMSVVGLSSSTSTLEFLQKVGFSLPWLAISTSAMKVELTGR